MQNGKFGGFDAASSASGYLPVIYGLNFFCGRLLGMGGHASQVGHADYCADGRHGATDQEDPIGGHLAGAAGDPERQRADGAEAE